MLTRRNFIAALMSIPFVSKLAAKPVAPVASQWSEPVGDITVPEWPTVDEVFRRAGIPNGFSRFRGGYYTEATFIPDIVIDPETGIARAIDPPWDYPLTH